MQVVWQASRGTQNDILCPVCGRGFLLYWTRSSPEDRAALMAEMVEALARQHAGCCEPDVHAEEAARAGDGLLGVLRSAAAERETTWGYC